MVSLHIEGTVAEPNLRLDKVEHSRCTQCNLRNAEVQCDSCNTPLCLDCARKIGGTLTYPRYYCDFCAETVALDVFGKRSICYIPLLVLLAALLILAIAW
ncbi:MAG: hypothetical protein JSW05_10305 [Candidatus Thorarchaeota archaeon]|nr:MAG: hypothetical protein JSW05_10305 [Candidatus Thorarchaeota archaeon]